MLWTVQGRHGRHFRDFALEAHSVAQAKRIALELAGFYAEHGSGTYGPMVWRTGTLTLVSELGDRHVIRRERPSYLKLLPPPAQARGRQRSSNQS